MATLGLCAYCEKIAAQTCPMCGKAICKEHTNDASQACVVCARGSSVGDESPTAGS